MFHNRRNYSLDYRPSRIDQEHQSKAVASLLDCSNTLKTKHSSKMLKIDHESICPWLHLNRKPLGETRNICRLVKTNRGFGKTYNRYKSKQATEHCREVQNKTVLATPKARLMLQEVENYNYLSSNVINLTRQLQLIHHKRKTNYVSNYIRQQLYLRLKTT